MTRLWRAATLVLMATVLVLGPGAALATAGEGNGRKDAPREQVREQVRTGPVNIVEDDTLPGSDTADPIRDRNRDRDRAQDRARDGDCASDRSTDRECDGDGPEIRPALQRCIEYVRTHVDEIRRNLRWWWRVCHRIAWNHNFPL